LLQGKIKLKIEGIFLMMLLKVIRMLKLVSEEEKFKNWRSSKGNQPK